MKVAWVLFAIAVLAGGGYFVYEFVTALQPGALDCTITWGREGC